MTLGQMVHVVMSTHASEQHVDVNAHASEQPIDMSTHAFTYIVCSCIFPICSK